MRCIHFSKTECEDKTCCELIERHSIFEDETYKEIVESNDVYKSFPLITDLRKKHFPLKLYRYRPPKPEKEEYLNSDLSGYVHFSSPKWGNFNDVLEVPINGKNISDYRTRVRDPRKVTSDNIRELVQIACFSERSNNNAMWYHYASKHKGFCIEYDTMKLYNMGRRYKTYKRTIWGSVELNEGRGHLLSLFPVLYSNFRYYPNSLNEYSDQYRFRKYNKHTEIDLLRSTIPAFIIKTRDWENEKEWRMLYSREMFYGNGMFFPENDCIDLSSCVTKIILGFDAAKDLENHIMTIAQNMNYAVSKLIRIQDVNCFREEQILPPKISDCNEKAKEEALLLQKIKHVIAEITDVPERLDLTNPLLYDDLRLDANYWGNILILEVVRALEEEFSIEIDFRVCGKWETVQDITDYIYTQFWR